MERLASASHRKELWAARFPVNVLRLEHATWLLVDLDGVPPWGNTREAAVLTTQAHPISGGI